MKSKKLGKSISKAEVLSISPFGLWILVGEQEFYLSHKEFPWFKNSEVSAVFDVRLERGKYLHWPELDVDLELDSLKHLEQYPLIAS